MSQNAYQWLVLLFDVSVKAVLLAAMAGLGLSLLRMRDANVRHRVWSATIAGMLALPLLVNWTPTIPLPSWLLPRRATQAEQVSSDVGGALSGGAAPIGQLPDVLPAGPNDMARPGWEEAPFTPEADFRVAQEQMGAEAVELEAPAVAREVASPVPWLTVLSSRWPQIALTIYAIGLLLFLARLLVAVVATRRLVRGARLVQTRLPGSQPGRGVSVLESNAIRVPLTVGCLRPRILLPPDWLTWSEEKLASVVAHERAHIARGDFGVTLLGEMNRCLYWFHPLAWYLRRKVAELAEQACDDAVIESTGDPTSYARHLLEIAATLAGRRRRITPLRVSMARKSNVETRINTILDTTRPLTRRFGVAGSLGLVVLMGVAVLVSAGLRAANDPPAEESVAETLADVSDLSKDAGGKSDSSSEGADARAGTDQNPDRTTDDNTAGSKSSARLAAKDVTVKPGETVELGDIKVARLSDGDQDAKGKENADQGTRQAADDAVAVRGMVVGPNGKAVVGADVYVTQSRRRPGMQAAQNRRLSHVKSGPGGEFSLNVPRAVKVSPGNRDAERWRPAPIIATADGFAPAWLSSTELGDNDPVILKLQQDGLTIRGRLVDLEGRPVAGARVSVKMLWRAETKAVDGWLADLKRLKADGVVPLPADKTIMYYQESRDLGKAYFPINQGFVAERLLSHHSVALPDDAVTDDDGRFQFERLGADRLAILEMSGPGIVKQIISVVTRRMEPVDARNRSSFTGYRSHVHYGASF